MPLFDKLEDEPTDPSTLPTDHAPDDHAPDDHTPDAPATEEPAPTPAPGEPSAQPDPGTPAESPTNDPPIGKLPSADDTTGQPQLPQHPRSTAEEETFSAFLHTMRAVQSIAIVLTEQHSGATYSHVVSEARTALAGLIGRAEGAASPNGAGA